MPRTLEIGKTYKSRDGDPYPPNFAGRLAAGPNNCIVWIGARTERGYGRLVVAGVRHSPHRFAWEYRFGNLPKELVLDHLCRNTSCVNMAHLEPVSNRENVLRGVGLSAVNARKTHCVKGHPLSGDNLAYKKGRKPHNAPIRRCKACDLASHIANYHRTKKYRSRHPEKDEAT